MANILDSDKYKRREYDNNIPVQVLGNVSGAFEESWLLLSGNLLGSLVSRQAEKLPSIPNRGSASFTRFIMRSNISTLKSKHQYLNNQSTLDAGLIFLFHPSGKKKVKK